MVISCCHCHAVHGLFEEQTWKKVASRHFTGKPVQGQPPLHAAADQHGSGIGILKNANVSKLGKQCIDSVPQNTAMHG